MEGLPAHLYPVSADGLALDAPGEIELDLLTILKAVSCLSDLRNPRPPAVQPGAGHREK